MMRRCTKCGTEYPATTDYFVKAQQGRLRGECKACTAKQHAENYQRNRASRNIAAREWVKNNPDARRETTKRYRERNRDKCKAAVAAWFAKDPTRARAINCEKTKRWYLKHLDHAREIRRVAVKRRKALKRGARELTLTRQQWNAIKELYDHCCAYCGQHKRLTQDHVIPLAKGGQHTAQNIVPACMTCNCSKKAGAPPVPIHALKFLPHSHTTISPSAEGPSPL